MQLTKKIRQKEVHIALLEKLVEFCHQQGIASWDDVVSARLQAAMDQPLWKLLELNGKYAQDCISEGVYLIEQATGKEVSKSTGKWPASVLHSAFPHLEDGSDPTVSRLYRCHLEHVISRKLLVSKLISSELSVSDVVNRYLLGCVILASEHLRLGLEGESIEDPWRKYREASPPVRVWHRREQAWIVDC